MIFNYYKKSSCKIERKPIILKGRGGSGAELALEFIYNLKSIGDPEKLDFYINQIDKLIIKEWGKFPEGFVRKHIEDSRIVILAIHNNSVVAFSAMSIKDICNKVVHYIEFSVVEREYQGMGLLQRINFILIKEALINNFVFNHLLSMELMFISPNIRTLSTLAKYSSFFYPNPFLYSRLLKALPQADDLTWNMAQELIKKSDNPNRKIEREGCVLNDSYKETPWLIYGLSKFLDVPKHHCDFFNDFVEKYLGHSNGQGKEFIVRARIGFLSVMRFILSKNLKLFCR